MAYYPQADEQMERVNQVLEPSIWPNCSYDQMYSAEILYMTKYVYHDFKQSVMKISLCYVN